MRPATVFPLLLAATVSAAPIPKDSGRDVLLRDWGTPVDPDGDCKFRVDGGVLRIAVPGTPHVMSAERGTTNAPRVMREVAGDFTAEVKVSGGFPADDKTPVEGRWAFFGAGLLVWEDDKNYVRLDRARMCNPRTGWRCYPNWELRAGGQMARGWSPQDGTLDEAKPAHLRVTRSGDKLLGYFSHDGKEWKSLPELTVKFGRAVKVGVCALQNTPTGYEAALEKLVVAPTKP